MIMQFRTKQFALTSSNGFNLVSLYISAHVISQIAELPVDCGNWIGAVLTGQIPPRGQFFKKRNHFQLFMHCDLDIKGKQLCAGNPNAVIYAL